jgi:uncharacterized RDD family membrane protein YckC
VTTPPENPVPQPAPSAPVPSPLADWGTRAIGFLIDYLPIIILNVLIYWSAALRYLGGLIGIGYWIYMGYLDGLTGQTPGKAIMGTRLVDTSGNLIGTGPGIGRKFAHILDSLVCMLGWFLPIVDSKRQTIADKLLTTFVVTGAERKQFAIDLWMPPKTPAA